MASIEQSVDIKLPCLCVVGACQLDSDVSRLLLMKKYPKWDFRFEEMFPSEDIFAFMKKRLLNFRQFGRIIFINTFLSTDDILKLDQIESRGPIHIFSSFHYVKQDTLCQLRNTLICQLSDSPIADFINYHIIDVMHWNEDSGLMKTGYSGSPRNITGTSASGYNADSKNWKVEDSRYPPCFPRDSAVLTILGTLCAGHPFDCGGWFSDTINVFLGCCMFRDVLLWSSPEYFAKTMQLTNFINFFRNYPHIVSADISRKQKTTRGTASRKKHYRTFNGVRICTVDDPNVSFEWAYLVANESNQSPKIGALVLRNQPSSLNDGIGVIFHKYINIDECQKKDQSESISNILGFPGGPLFTFRWFHDEQEFNNFYESTKIFINRILIAY